MIFKVCVLKFFIKGLVYKQKEKRRREGGGRDGEKELVYLRTPDKSSYGACDTTTTATSKCQCREKEKREGKNPRHAYYRPAQISTWGGLDLSTHTDDHFNQKTGTQREKRKTKGKKERNSFQNLLFSS